MECHPPPHCPPPCYACPEISACKNLLKSHENQPSWIFKVRYIKANDLLHTLMGWDGAWYKQLLVITDGMFKNGILWNIGKCKLGWFSLRQSHIERGIQKCIWKNEPLLFYSTIVCRRGINSKSYSLYLPYNANHWGRYVMLHLYGSQFPIIWLAVLLYNYHHIMQIIWGVKVLWVVKAHLICWKTLQQFAYTQKQVLCGTL